MIYFKLQLTVKAKVFFNLFKDKTTNCTIYLVYFNGKSYWAVREDVRYHLTYSILYSIQPVSTSDKKLIIDNPKIRKYLPVNFSLATPCSSPATMKKAITGRTAPFMVIETDILSSGISWKSRYVMTFT